MHRNLIFLCQKKVAECLMNPSMKYFRIFGGEKHDLRGKKWTLIGKARSCLFKMGNGENHMAKTLDPTEILKRLIVP